MMPWRRPCWPAATGSRSRATPWPLRFAITPRRRWMCRTASPVISPSFARPPAYPPRSTPTAFRYPPAAADLLARGIVGIDAIVAGGDDYEILCAVPENRFAAFAQAAAAAEVAVTTIGTIIAGAAVPVFLDAQGKQIALRRASYSHFQQFWEKRSAATVLKNLPKSMVFCTPQRCARVTILAWSRRFVGRPFGQGRPPFYAPAASRGNGEGLHQDLRQIQ